jgi:hypothetical protein
MVNKLCCHHEQQGAFAQINLLLKGLKIEFSYKKPIHDNLSELRECYNCIASMGTLKLDDVYCVLLMNTMNRHLGPIQQNIHSISSNANFSSALITTCLFEEDHLVQ